METGKCAIVDFYYFTNHEIIRGILRILIDVISSTEHAHDLALTKRLRLCILATSLEEVYYVGRIYKLVLNFTYQNALYKYIAGLKVFFFNDLFPVFNGKNLFCRN